MSELEQLEQAIAALEAQRATLGDAVVEAMLAPAREKLVTLRAASQTRTLTEHRKLMTILFADVSGFTAISETIDAEEMQDILRQLWARLDGVIQRHGGTIDKHIGDAVMGVWGVKQLHEDDPVEAVRAGLALQRELAQFGVAMAGQSKIENLKSKIAIRVGINTGLASVSFIASTGERNVIGDTVNLASRLEHAAPVNGVLISQATYDGVRGLFDVEPQPPLQVKGKAEPVDTYLVTREKPRTFEIQRRGLVGVTTRTIGRDQELACLTEAYQEAYSGDTIRWVTITGEAGVGKSRLLAEFEHWIELRPEQIWYLKTRAWPHTQRTPYFLLRDLLAFRFQIGDNDSLTVAREKLEEGFAEVMGEALGQEAAAFLGQLAGLDFSQSRWISNIAADTRQIRGRARVLLEQYLAYLCAGGPAVLLLEDLHWADEESLALLADIVSQPLPWSLCVVGLARPSFWERPVSWGQAAHHRRLDLAPLGHDMAHALVRELLQKMEQPPEWLEELLVERGGGNPYFTEELVRWLIEQDVIEADDESWQVNPGRSVGLSVPGTIQGVLQARLERLNRGERAALQQAAVLGRAFWDGAVAYVGDQPIPAERWEGLQKRDLVYQQAASQLPDEVERHFKHALLRDVVYEYTLKKLRAGYHKRAAEWLVQTAAERAGEWAAVIAQHYEQAGERGLAAEWYGQAGKQAHDTHAPAIAVEYYQKALTLLPAGAEQVARRLSWWEGLGETLGGLARFAEAAEAYSQMRQAAEAAGNRVAQARAWNGLATMQQGQGNNRAMLESAGQAKGLAERIGAGKELASALYCRGWAFYRLGDAATALAHGEQALAVGQAAGEAAGREQADSLKLLGLAYQTLGRFEPAKEHQEHALAIYRALGDRRSVASMQNNLGEMLRSSGDYAAAVQRYGEALTMIREIGNRDLEIAVLNNLGAARVGLGEYDAAEADLRQAIAMAHAGWFALSETYRFWAEACLGQARPMPPCPERESQLAEALEAARRALALGQETENPEFIGGAWRALGQIAAEMEGVAAGVASPAHCFGESLQIFTEMGAQAERARTLREWARYELEKGNAERGQQMWEKARDMFEQLGMGMEVVQMNKEGG
jgi:predicted ATPase/class 3 adenylate cyclase